MWEKRDQLTLNNLNTQWTNTGGSSVAIELAASATQALSRCLMSTDMYILSSWTR
jgi:hypothetical protein